MAKYTYRIEFFIREKWFAPAGLQGEQRGFLRGYMFGRSDAPPPRPAMRVVRSDDVVVDEREATDEVDIGMIAGWPTPEQYEAAAQRALDAAALIRERLASKP